MAKEKKRLGDMLVDQGVVSPDQVVIAITEQRKTKKPLGQVFIDLGFVTEHVIRDTLAETFGQESIDLSSAVPDSEALAMVPKNVATRNNVVPISFNQRSSELRLAMADVYDVMVLDRIRSILPLDVDIVPLLATETEIRSALDLFYGYELSVDGILKEIETGEVDWHSLEAVGQEYSQPLVRLVDAVLSDAVKRDVSDIHFEPERGFLR